jgi:retron-type reverse transcriptase
LYIETTYGVPQGSILEAIQFVLYINDLPAYVQIAKLVLYADDTNIHVVDKDIKVFELKLHQ